MRPLELAVALGLLSGCASNSAPAVATLSTPCPVSGPAGGPTLQMLAPSNGATEVTSDAGITVELVNIPPGSGTLVISLSPLTLVPASGSALKTSNLLGVSYATYAGTMPTLLTATSYTVVRQEAGIADETIGCFTTH